MLPLFEDGKLAQHVCMLSWSNSVIPWVIILQAPLFMGFLRQEYWSGLPCLPPGDLPDPGMEPCTDMGLTTGGLFTGGLFPPGKPQLAQRLSHLFIQSFNNRSLAI